MKFTAVLLTLFICQIANAQTTPFETVISSPGGQLNGVGSVQMPDGNIYMVGNIQTDTTNGTDILMVKMAEDGTVLWSKSYDEGQTEATYDFIYKNGEFIIVGETIQNSPFDRDGFILKLDEDGNQLDFEIAGSPSKNEQYYGISETPTGFVITGHISADVGSGNDVLIRHVGAGLLDSWEQVYGDTVNDIGIAVRRLPNGNFLVVGDRQVETQKYNPFAMLLDERGDLIYDKVIESEYNGGCKNMILVDEAHALVIGEMATPTSSSFDVFLAKVDSTAETLWLNYVPSTESPDAGFDICRVNSGSFFLTGYSWNEATSNSDIAVVSVDSEGNEIDRLYFGGTGLDIAYDVKPSINGGFIATGKTGNGSDQNALVIHDMLELATSVREVVPAAEEVWLSPNPAISGSTVRIVGDWDGADFQVVDAAGKVLSTGQVSGNQISIEPASGNYFVRITLGDRTGLGQLVVK